MLRVVLHPGRYYKYELAEDYTHDTELRGFDIEVPFIRLHPDGQLVLQTGYSWDGASGPSLDTDTFVRGSLVHDALYQLIKLGALPPSTRAAADRLLHATARADGMWAPRAAWVWAAVRLFGGVYLGKPQPYKNYAPSR
jgi:hypothetical protein